MNPTFTVMGKSLSPFAKPWIQADHPLLPRQYFHSPPPYAYIPFHYYPAGTLLYNHYHGYFTLTHPQYQNPLPKLDGDVKQQAVVLEKEVSRKAFVPPPPPPPPQLDGHIRKKNVPPRLLRDGIINGGFIFRSNNKSDTSVERKPKRSFPPPPENRTTVMIKNIPNKLRRDNLMEFLDGYCRDHRLEYDFIYLPIDFKWLDNLGYAFVNFTTGNAAVMIMELLANYKWGGVDPIGCNKGCQQSKKICEVTWAKIQGKKKLVKHFKDSAFACHTVDFLPAEFDPPRNGWTTDTKPKYIGKLKPTGPYYPSHLVRWKKASRSQ